MTLQKYMDRFGTSAIDDSKFNSKYSEYLCGTTTAFDHNTEIASYFRLNEFAANANWDHKDGF